MYTVGYRPLGQPWIKKLTGELHVACRDFGEDLIAKILVHVQNNEIFARTRQDFQRLDEHFTVNVIIRNNLTTQVLKDP